MYYISISPFLMMLFSSQQALWNATSSNFAAAIFELVAFLRTGCGLVAVYAKLMKSTPGSSCPLMTELLRLSRVYIDFPSPY